MFSHAPDNFEIALRAAATVGVVTDIVLDLTQQQPSSGFCLILRNTGRTAGSVVVTFFGSGLLAAQAVNLGSDLSRTITTAGLTIIPLNGTFPPYMKIRLTPAGGYDGSLAVALRCANYNSAVSIS